VKKRSDFLYTVWRETVINAIERRLNLSASNAFLFMPAGFCRPQPNVPTHELQWHVQQ
jgi:hypothetical protein